MGLLPSHLHVLAMEQKKHPIKGEVLTIGQMAVYETVEGVKKIYQSHGIAPKALLANFDTVNKIPHTVGTPRGTFTNGNTVLSLLGADKVLTADISNYEGADYIFDLNNPVDSKYHEKFDAILDSGTLEHLFDVPTALANLARMVKRGGRLMFILPCSNTINHGFYSFNPNVFFDFFSANGFSDFSCYLLEGSSFNVYRKAKVYQYTMRSIINEYPLHTPNMVELCFFATKNQDANLQEIKKPIQGMYLATDWGKKSLAAVVNSEPSNLETIKRKMEFATRRWRPEFIDRLWKSKRRQENVTYLGTF